MYDFIQSLVEAHGENSVFIDNVRLRNHPMFFFIGLPRWLARLIFPLKVIEIKPRAIHPHIEFDVRAVYRLYVVTYTIAVV